MKIAKFNILNCNLAIYMPPATGKSKLIEDIKAKVPQAKVFDTDQIIYSHFMAIRPDIIEVLKPSYNLIVTNRWQLKGIDCGFFPSKGRIINNFMRTDDKDDLIFRLSLCRGTDKLLIAMSVPYPLHILHDDIQVNEDASIIIKYNELNTY